MSPSIGPVGSGCGLSNQFIDYLPYDLATLAGYGWQFALGRVDDIQPAVYNTEDGSPPSDRQPEGMILTPVVIGVETVLRGVAQPGAVRVLVEGGTIGCYTIRVDQAPRVAKGERAVFVLSPARNADGKPLGGLLEMRFAWPVDENDTVNTPDGTMSISKLRETLSQLPPATPS